MADESGGCHAAESADIGAGQSIRPCRRRSVRSPGLPSIAVGIEQRGATRAAPPAPLPRCHAARILINTLSTPANDRHAEANVART
jgi:hypothetical protein